MKYAINTPVASSKQKNQRLSPLWASGNALELCLLCLCTLALTLAVPSVGWGRNHKREGNIFFGYRNKTMTMAQENLSVKPPVAKKSPRTTTVHGDTLVDDYYWMREKNSPEVIAHLEAENAYTDAVMKPDRKSVV